MMWMIKRRGIHLKYAELKEKKRDHEFNKLDKNIDFFLLLRKNIFLNIKKNMSLRSGIFF